MKQLQTLYKKNVKKKHILSNEKKSCYFIEPYVCTHVFDKIDYINYSNNLA